MRKFLLTVMLSATLVVCFQLFAQAQNNTVTGTVTDGQGVPLPGATVLVKKSTVSTATNQDGKYSINASKGSTLTFSFIGMVTKEITVGNSNVINVAMEDESKKLQEVVVVGYGTQKRADVTSSIASISAKDLKDLQVAGIDQALQGKVSGVTVTNNGGQPGGGVSVRVRGITSINGNEPLYVIDGVPISATKMTTAQDQLGGMPGQTTQSAIAGVDPNDIASIDILKDASAQAIYGSRGANGVVIITTKRGKSGEGKLSYDFYIGQQQTPTRLNMMNLSQYATYQNEIMKEMADVNGTEYFPIGEFANPSILGKGTDWQDAVFQTGLMQNHQLSFSGGQEKSSYYLSLNYFDQQGTIIGSGFDRLSLRLNLDNQLKSWLKVGVSSFLTRTNQRTTLTNGSEAVVNWATGNSPAAPVMSGDDFAGPINVGGYNYGSPYNPVAYATLRDVGGVDSRANGNVYGDIIFNKHFTLKNQFGFNYSVTENKAFQPYATSGSFIIMSPSKLVEDRGVGTFWQLSNYLDYNQSFGKHNVNAQLGHESSESHYNGLNAARQNLTMNFQSINAGSATDQSVGGGIYENALESYFARAGYSYADRYSANFSIRRDGSSTFGPDKRYGYFPSGSLGWTITNENFAKDWKGLNYLKFRAGAGVVGGQNWQGSNAYATNIRLFPIAPFGPGGIPDNVGNPGYQWEETVSYNTGLDFGFLSNRIELSVDAYKKSTSNMLMFAKLPVYSGIGDQWNDIKAPVVNAGEMTNTGFEFKLTTYNINKNNFSWQSNLVLSTYKNKLNKLNNESAAIYTYTEYSNAVTLTKSAPGGPVGRFFGYVTDGLFTSEEQIRNSADQQVGIGPKGTWLGDVKYKDISGDGKIDAADMTYIGNPNPNFTFGFTNSFKYKGFDLSLFLQGSQGGDILNYSKKITEGMVGVYNNQLTDVANRYTSTNTSTSIPRFNPWHQQNIVMSDRFIEDGSYLRIQNLTLGYNLPARIISKAKLSNARIYLTGQNLYTFTKYTGFDPELGAFNNNALMMNVDNGNYPTPRTFTMGVNLTF
ncbi:TonB-dependent receptor [Solitalea sp. MAHUQ-68]|uniref:TonB-dependent receptor n=1 Tax=Solitalea agri TaxID=2953739 RepID=A0A9X2JBI7_9SPHI|nr:TonB-dependent receptor [Solitalea agri]MCO4292522.1 TonB-dependent receptor [Solitalea agri]